MCLACMMGIIEEAKVPPRGSSASGTKFGCVEWGHIGAEEIDPLHVKSNICTDSCQMDDEIRLTVGGRVLKLHD